jgi:ABC-type thiamin/hydroxymethylpyrimidine transport system permease subunit
MVILYGVWIVAAIIAAFWLGTKRGATVAKNLLAIEQAASASVRKDRDEARLLLTRIKLAAGAAGIDLKKAFPFLALILMIVLRRIHT